MLSSAQAQTPYKNISCGVIVKFAAVGIQNGNGKLLSNIFPQDILSKYIALHGFYRGGSQNLFREVGASK